MSISAKRQCKRQVAQVVYMPKNRLDMQKLMMNTIARGPKGELIPLSSLQVSMMRNATKQLAIVTVILPKKLNKAPIPPVKIKAAEFLRMRQNPLMAAMQKLSPVNAI